MRQSTGIRGRMTPEVVAIVGYDRGTEVPPRASNTGGADRRPLERPRPMTERTCSALACLAGTC